MLTYDYPFTKMISMPYSITNFTKIIYRDYTVI